MGNKNSTRWGGHTKKRLVEDCRRISAREAQHVGMATTTTPVANSAARRLWCLCPSCGARVWYLYQVSSQAPDAGAAEQWGCRQCHELTYTSAQQRGTWAAFYADLTQEKWKAYTDQHASLDWLYARVKESWDKLCAPYDLRSLSAEEELRLIASMGSKEKVQFYYERQLWKWSGVRDRLEQRAARWAMRDLKAEWKQRHRSNGGQTVKD